MKYCPKCKTKKELDQFSKSKFNTDGYCGYCKVCVRKTTNEHYKNNKERYLTNHKKYKKKRYEWLEELKCSIGCIKCKENKWWLIDFHHLDPKIKESDISIMLRKGHNRELIENEIKKCITLCSNCHRDFHYQEKMNNITIEEYLETKLEDEQQVL